MKDSPVRYARNGDVRLAYRVFGESGPIVIWAPGWVVNNVDTIDGPDSPYAPLIERLSQAMQFVIWDRRGTGLSDPTTHILSLDERVDDLKAVVDAVGGAGPAILGSSEGGAVCLLFAATYPDRVHSLGLYGTAARFAQELPDFPWGFTASEIEAQIDEIDRRWGEGALAELYFGAMAETPGIRQMFGKLQRSIASPTTAKLWWRALTQIDVRSVLSGVRAPTMVLARPEDRLVPIEAAAALAAAIPDAQFHSLAPGPHNGFDIIAELTERVLRFIVETPDVPAEERVLRTVLFTDIVGSTEKLTASGDEHWRHQLDNHDSLVDHILLKYSGIRANHTGDGIFALFDTPTKAANCALELVPALAARGIPIRAGIHTGECERRGDQWSGLAVHTGARIGAMAGPGEVLSSRTVRDLSAGSGVRFCSRRLHQLKGLPEDTELFQVVDPQAP